MISTPVNPDTLDSLTQRFTRDWAPSGRGRYLEIYGAFYNLFLHSITNSGKIPQRLKKELKIPEPSIVVTYRLGREPVYRRGANSLLFPARYEQKGDSVPVVYLEGDVLPKQEQVKVSAGIMGYHRKRGPRSFIYKGG